MWDGIIKEQKSMKEWRRSLGMEQKKAVIGLSGGVDSAAAAYLLKKQGYEVAGVTMRVLGKENRETEEKMAADAEKVAQTLGISHETVDFTEVFHEKVIRCFTEEYLRGRTPNPCVLCNRYVKWEALWSYARKIGADFLATGHYARIKRLANGRYTVWNSAAADKDQTYVLFGLTQEQLARTLMPVGDYTKQQIREMAGRAGIPVAEKKDSQEICFIPDHDYAAFIERMRPESVKGEGNFVTPDGKVLGKHKGLIRYTVGQRKGLGIAFGEPVFVKELRPDSNEVVLAGAEELYRDSLVCDRINFMGIGPMEPGQSMRVTGKIRYAHRGTPAVITMLKDGGLRADFDEPVRAVTPGQAAVFYDGEYLACGGFIRG